MCGGDDAGFMTDHNVVAMVTAGGRGTWERRHPVNNLPWQQARIAGKQQHKGHVDAWSSSHTETGSSFSYLLTYLYGENLLMTVVPHCVSERQSNLVIDNLLRGHRWILLTFFSFISTLLRFIFSPEADVKWGEKLNGYSLASCVKNICAKNHQNLTIFLQITIENVTDVFET